VVVHLIVAVPQSVRGGLLPLLGILKCVDISYLCVKIMAAETEIPENVSVWIFRRQHTRHVIVYAVSVTAYGKFLKGHVETDIPAEEVIVPQTEIHAHTRKDIEVEYVAIDITVIENQRIVFG
jgi:hypothetical protein